MEDRIRKKLLNLCSLAKRPGTPQEGELARQTAIRLCQKYGVTCEFSVKGPTSTRPTASAPKPNAAHETLSDDAIFYQWIKSLSELGWKVYNCVDTKIGRQIRFRKPGWNSEIRITQRKTGDDFEVDHVMRPDPDIHGFDRSYTCYMTINLGELLRHLLYTK